VLVASAYELMVVCWWASGRIAPITDFWSRPVLGVSQLLLSLYWNDGHFYFAHRVMHPYWPAKSAWVPLDLGRWLYRRVHSLHHRSYNTGPWAGIAMHPVEHVIYFTRTFLPVLLVPQHPIHMLFNHYHTLVSPLPGHDGYANPGGGSHFHYLHHAHFKCNYGTPMVPFDRLFGSFEDGSSWVKAQRAAAKEE
jgi:sterol desaturase/sphingolipid hydroxylase (fatty acid hydroxylase superfamily)